MKTTPKANSQPRRRLSVFPAFTAFPIKSDSRKSILAAVAIATALSPFASAASFAFNLNVEFSGGSNPVGAAPWITATFDDTTSGTAGVIRLTVAANNLSGSEKVGGFYFNLDPSFNAADLTFSIVSPNPTGLTDSDIKRGNNAYKADGDGFYDVLLDFPENTLIAGETLTLDVSRVGGLTLQNFIYGSSPTGPNGNGSSPNGTFYAAAHVLSIAPGDTSGWIGQRDTTTVFIIPTNPIPEPSSVTLVGLAMVAVCLRRKR